MTAKLTFAANGGDGAPEGIDDIATVDGRAAFLKEALGASGFDPDFAASVDAATAEEPVETVAEANGQESAPAPAKKPEAAAAEVIKAAVAEPPPAPPAAPSSIAEKYAALREKEQANYRRSVEQKQAEQRMAEIERAAASIAEREAMIAPLLKIVRDKDLMALNEFVGEHFAPEDVAAAVGKWTSDEAREKYRTTAVKREALELADAKIARLEKLLEEHVIKPKQQEAEAAEVQSVLDRFGAFVKENAPLAPATSALLESNPEWLFAQADAAAIMLKRKTGSASWPEVVSYLEKNLPRAPAPPQQPAPSSTGTSATTNAAAKATTVTNGHAADRTTVAESEEPKEGASVDEVAARLKREWYGAALNNQRR